MHDKFSTSSGNGLGALAPLINTSLLSPLLSCGIAREACGLCVGRRGPISSAPVIQTHQKQDVLNTYAESSVVFSAPWAVVPAGFCSAVPKSCCEFRGLRLKHLRLSSLVAIKSQNDFFCFVERLWGSHGVPQSLREKLTAESHLHAQVPAEHFNKRRIWSGSDMTLHLLQRSGDIT